MWSTRFALRSAPSSQGTDSVLLCSWLPMLTDVCACALNSRLLHIFLSFFLQEVGLPLAATAVIHSLEDPTCECAFASAHCISKAPGVREFVTAVHGCVAPCDLVCHASICHGPAAVAFMCCECTCTDHAALLTCKLLLAGSTHDSLPRLVPHLPSLLIATPVLLICMRC